VYPSPSSLNGYWKGGNGIKVSRGGGDSKAPEKEASPILKNRGAVLELGLI